MLRIALGIAVFACASMAVAEDARPMQMEFSAFYPCRGSASFCAPQLLASGEIDADAAERLGHILDTNVYGTIAFDSPGGNLQGGLALGVLIRDRGIHTRVAAAYFEEALVEGGGSEIRTRVNGAGCFSACAYAFMGGVSRTLEEGGQIGVHQFYGDGLDNAQATTQAMTAVLSQYMRLMGVDREILDVASFTGSEEMTVIGVEDAVRYNLDNQHPLLASWQLIAMDGGEAAVAIAQQQSGGDRETSIAIVRYEEDAEVLGVVVRHGPFPNVDEARFAAALQILDSRPTFCAGVDGCAVMYSAQKWHYEPDTKSILGIYLVDTDPLATVVLSSETLYFSGDFPNVYASVAPDVELGRSGLRNALLALYK